MQTPLRHEPVLLAEVLSHFPKEPRIVIDGTVGDGGHAEAIVETFPSIQTYYAFDRDVQSLERAKKNLERFGSRIECAHASFDAIAQVIPAARADAILLDLGFSSAQIDNAGRGFSFLHDGPLDMRYDSEQQLTAGQIVNSWDEQSIAKILMEYGEEPNARQLARAIIKRRKQRRIETTKDLAETVLTWYREKLRSKREIPWIGGLHPATRTFQALRIEVNDELKTIERALPQLAGLLAKNGRLIVISFHSKEDKIIKKYFKYESSDCVCPPELPACACHHTASLRTLTKKVITATEEEIQQNNKSRSAKLRVAEKI